MIQKWNPLVNTEFAIEGDYGYGDDYIVSLRFESGKERTHLRNNFVHKTFPALSLLLDNIDTIVAGPNNTEFKQFIAWYEVGLRYGILPFYLNRLLNKAEIGVYKFIPESLLYTDTDGHITVNFGLEEIG